MNNQEALDFMKSYSSIREATEVFCSPIKSLMVRAILFEESCLNSNLTVIATPEEMI